MDFVDFEGRRYYGAEGRYFGTRATRKERREGQSDRMLHRDIWETRNGPIPEGYEIHHKDGNKGNNDLANLELLTVHEHKSLHAVARNNLAEWRATPEGRAKLAEVGPRIKELWRTDREKMLRGTVAGIALAQEAATEWHKSPAGREWHHQQAITRKPARIEIKSCEVCGAEYPSKNSRSKFCHQNCKATARRRRNSNP